MLRSLRIADNEASNGGGIVFAGGYHSVHTPSLLDGLSVHHQFRQIVGGAIRRNILRGQAEAWGGRAMLTHGTVFSLRGRRALGGLLATVLSLSATTVGEAAVPPGGWTLRPGCDNSCELLHVSGDSIKTRPPVIAAPGGTTYSVSHRVGADFDDDGPQPITCFFIYSFALPGAQDDIVTFDGLTPEAIRTDFFGTVPKVIETDDPQPNGQRLITIQTESPIGTDLFPAGFIQGGRVLTDACFSIGLEDPLTWFGSDTIVVATIEFLTDDVVMAGPFDAISFFTDPWDGVAEITLPGGAGNGFNGVRLTLLAEKSISVANDACEQQIEAFNGDTAFSNIGATTDGPDEPTECYFFSYSDIESDIWYRYTATCTGNLTVDLCNSNYDTKVAVYDGCLECPVDTLPLACNDDFGGCGTRSLATAPVVSGQCYTIRIGGYLGVQGTGTMRLSCSIIQPPSGACCDDGVCLGTKTEVDCLSQNGTWFSGGACPGFSCPVLPPPNNECADCIRVLTGVPYQGRTRGATGTDISSCGTNDTLDAWNCWTADCTGQVSITTCGSSFDTTLAVYDACGGAQLACDDDGCQFGPPFTRSKVTLNVTEGTTYAIRVSGHNGAAGDYTLNVESCRNACCLSDGRCFMRTLAQCESFAGTWLGPGTQCGGDLDGDGINDACELCPQATIAGVAPESGTVDARQPNARNASLPRHGIGSPGGGGARRESIVILLDPPVPEGEGCFDVCETRDDPLTATNTIGSVTYHGSGIYELVLDHAISAGGVTTIEYLGDGSFVEFIAHPGNVDGGPMADASDVGEHMDCCLSGLCTPMWDAFSCDADRSLLVTPADTLVIIDLLIGTQVWDPWLSTPLPARGNTCP